MLDSENLVSHPYLPTAILLGMEKRVCLPLRVDAIMQPWLGRVCSLGTIENRSEGNVVCLVVCFLDLEAGAQPAYREENVMGYFVPGIPNHVARCVRRALVDVTRQARPPAIPFSNGRQVREGWWRAVRSLCVGVSGGGWSNRLQQFPEVASRGQLPQDRCSVRSRATGQVARPAVKGFVCQHGEGKGFLRVQLGPIFR